MRFVLLSCLIVAVLGSGLYFAKLTVDEQYRTLKQLELEIESQTEHNYVLQAEWTFLTRPERLLRLSHSLLGMNSCLLYTSPSPRDATLSRMPSSA